jgi:GAF domain-containing protein
VVDGETLGGLNLYASAPNAFSEDHRAQAGELATQCSAALTVSLRQVQQTQVQRQLAEAMVSSSIID